MNPNEENQDRGEFVDKEPSTFSKVIKVIAAAVIILGGIWLVWFFFNEGIQGPQKKVVEKTSSNFSEFVPEFKVPVVEKPTPKPPDPPKPPEPPKPVPKKSISKQIVDRIKPVKIDKDLERRLNSGLDHVKKEDRNLRSKSTGKNVASMQRNTVVPNIDLTVTKTETVGASMLPSLRWIVPKGTPISCALETAIQSNQPGLIKCTITEDIYSADNTIKLIDRGSVATGEYRTQSISYGKNRIFAIWDRIRTPQGVVINIDSPATDDLGRAGIGGFIDNHYFERFGTAILISIITDGFDQNTSKDFDDTHDSMNDVAASIILEYSRIKPTLHTWQGARVLIFTARDFDLSNVYSLEHNPGLMDIYRNKDLSKTHEGTNVQYQ